LKAAVISLTRLKGSLTLTVMAWRMLAVVTGLMGIVRMVGIVAGAVGGPVAADGIVDAAGAVDGRAAAGATAGVVGLAAEDTRIFCHGFSRIHADKI